MIARWLLATIVKDMRLLARDRVGLVFLTIAPLIVMSVAGFSLSTLFGGAPQRDAAYLVPVVDEDGGRIADLLREHLANDPTIEIKIVPNRDAALDLLRSRTSGAALIVPEGTWAALAHGSSGSLLLLTDPVKFVEVANVRFLVQEFRQAIGQQAIDRAQRRIDRVRARALAAQQRLSRRFDRLRAALGDADASAGKLRTDMVRRIEAARARLERELRAQLAELEAQRLGMAAERLEKAIQHLRRYLDAIVAYRGSF